MASVQLSWKNFQVDLTKVTLYFKQNLSQNYDGIVCNSDNLVVMFIQDASEEDLSKIDTYWNSIIASDFQPTLQEIIQVKLDKAISFGNELMMQATVENVAMGITQVGKTREIADLFTKLQYYLKTGSLYAAIDEIDHIIAAGLDSSLQPFVTESRLQSYKQKIQTYLSVQ